jgi:predicted glycoside hydrolase/deacetylase ChbG (UPF0249 family)
MTGQPNNEQVQSQWARVRGKLRAEMGETAYKNWLKKLTLLQILAALPAGITELGCHPGLGDDVDSMYRSERAHELQALCDPRIRESLTKEGIELRSFRDFDRQRIQR